MKGKKLREEMVNCVYLKLKPLISFIGMPPNKASRPNMEDTRGQ
jgi:hypothetical protein